MRAARFAVVIASVALFGACSKPDSDATEDTAIAADSGTAESQPAVASTAETTAESSMTVEDIDRWKKGMDAELEAVRKVGTKFKAARNSTDSLSAMMEANETATREVGGQATGVSASRYGLIASTLSSIVRYMAPMELEMDTKQMPAEIRTSMQQTRDEAITRLTPSFPLAVVEALRPRAAALRKQELALAEERMRAAGMIP